MKITKIARKPGKGDLLIIAGNISQIDTTLLSADELKYVRKKFRADKDKRFHFNRFDHHVFISIIPREKNFPLSQEAWRKGGHDALTELAGKKVSRLSIIDLTNEKGRVMAFLEGMHLGSYQFLKYRKDADEKRITLEEVRVYSKHISTEEIEELLLVSDAVFRARDMVNEPLSFLTATRLAKEIEGFGEKSGAKVEVLTMAKIKALKMGGLLAVNRGSLDPPTFSIIEWKPDNAVNKKPLILVGKGVVYDTGGLSLKPSKYMETMKCDMAGAATMAAATYAIAMLKLPVHVIGLIPATDNRPDGNAYTPGDIIRMYDGSTVEVLNTDAEGRMILADALAYAKKYEPMLVIDAATLTGAAVHAIGHYGIVAMHSGAGSWFRKLGKAGDSVHERLVEFPFWDEYKDLLKSEVADMKNIGGPFAGMITAGKFLEHFTDYPYIHLDIAGPAFLEKKDSYRGLGGTGTGIRLIVEFARELARKS